jgi:hypothetical protein
VATSLRSVVTLDGLAGVAFGYRRDFEIRGLPFPAMPLLASEAVERCRPTLMSKPILDYVRLSLRKIERLRQVLINLGPIANSLPWLKAARSVRRLLRSGSAQWGGVWREGV